MKLNYRRAGISSFILLTISVIVLSLLFYKKYSLSVKKKFYKNEYVFAKEKIENSGSELIHSLMSDISMQEVKLSLDRFSLNIYPDGRSYWNYNSKSYIILTDSVCDEVYSKYDRGSDIINSNILKEINTEFQTKGNTISMKIFSKEYIINIHDIRLFNKNYQALILIEKNEILKPLKKDLQFITLIILLGNFILIILLIIASFNISGFVKKKYSTE